MNKVYAEAEPARAEIDAIKGPVLVEFGAPWCPHCQAAQAPLESAMRSHAQVRHFKIEDGSGRRLGRSFGVKLWPTLVFLKNGQEVSRLVRPTTQSPIDQALAAIDDGPAR